MPLPRSCSPIASLSPPGPHDLSFAFSWEVPAPSSFPELHHLPLGAAVLIFFHKPTWASVILSHVSQLPSGSSVASLNPPGPHMTLSLLLLRFRDFIKASLSYSKWLGLSTAQSVGHAQLIPLHQTNNKQTSPNLVCLNFLCSTLRLLSLKFFYFPLINNLYPYNLSPLKKKKILPRLYWKLSQGL